MRGHGADVVDFYCDDELRPDDPNMQLQILTEVDEEEEEGGEKAKKKKPYPPKPMLVDQGTCSILFAGKCFFTFSHFSISEKFMRTFSTLCFFRVHS